MNKLVIAEKPSVALRLALSLSETGPVRKVSNSVSYFEVKNGADTLFIVAAAGHLFSIAQKSNTYTIPVFDVEWVPSYKTNKFAYFTKKYLDAIYAVSRSCNVFINACDYDIEGTVIGANIIKYVTSGDVNKNILDGNVKRMRFSTTTRSDLLESYAKLDNFDRNNFDAGEARHVLDWLWGINLSRALMRAIHTTGEKKTLSIGRVQGPALSLIVKRDIEIKSFVPKGYWQVHAVIGTVSFENIRGAIFEERSASEIVAKSKGKMAHVDLVEVKETKMRPFPPFDLTSMQIEASKVLGMDPSRTLAVAQSLYERSYISYPRTSSQKLPPTLNLPRVITELAKNENFSKDANMLIQEHRFRPAEGMKQDEAHPAIYPTGEKPSKLSPEEEKLYTLIARRFLSVFADYAAIQNTKVSVSIAGEKYVASGNVVTTQGWLAVYQYFKPREKMIPKFDQGTDLKVSSLETSKHATEPPERYTKASLISLLENKELGTKATRAEIVDTLFKRGYAKGIRIEATELGHSVYEALDKYSKEILDENLTRKLESDMEGVMKGTMQEEAVINEGKSIITEIIGEFKKNEKEIGKVLNAGVKAAEISSIIGKCNKCGGNLMLKHSSGGKNFAGCSNWPSCTNSYPLPANAFIKPTGKICEICHTPKVKVFRRGKGVFEMDLDPNCSSKANWGKKQEVKKVEVKKVEEKKTQEKKVEAPKLEVKKPTAPKPKSKTKKVKKNVHLSKDIQEA